MLLNQDTKNRGLRERKLKDNIQLQQERLERLQDNLADGLISSKDFVEMKSRYMALKLHSEQDLSILQKDCNVKSKLLLDGVKAISKLGKVYERQKPEGTLQFLGSIFPEMLEFDGKKCRTTKINEALALCLSVDKGFSQKENRTFHVKLEVSRWVES